MAGQALMVREIQHGSPEYRETVGLRDAILRKPLGLAFSAAELEAEQDSHHLAGYCGGLLVACLVLRPLADGQVQMRQVAVAAGWQGRGLGRALVDYAEDLARRLGFGRMVLHARQTAVPFYEKLGYGCLGGAFQEVGIEHWAMEKRLTP